MPRPRAVEAHVCCYKRRCGKIFLAYVCSCERESPRRKAVACAAGSTTYPETSCDIVVPVTCTFHISRTRDSDCALPACRSSLEASVARFEPRLRFSKCLRVLAQDEGSHPNASISAHSVHRGSKQRRQCRGHSRRVHAALKVLSQTHFARTRNEDDRDCHVSKEIESGDCKVRKRRRRERLGFA